MLLKRTTSNNPDFQKLVLLLDQFLRSKDDEDHDFYAQYNKTDHIKHVVVAYHENEAIGCGAFKAFDENSVEIKRMFVADAYRGQQIAHQIINELELWAKELKYSCYVLETGTNNPRAIALYQKLGYLIVPNYGPYEGISTSICLQKKSDMLIPK
ncbi:MAG: GNAT family N-acetyltransferase [Flavobacterium sp.]